MSYEINVSLNGVNFFTTADRSITKKEKLVVVHATIMKKFPAAEGYEVSVYEKREDGFTYYLRPDDF